MGQSGTRRGIPRRGFLGDFAAAAASVAFLPRRLLGGEAGSAPPSARVNVAKIGCGGMGGGDLGAVAGCGANIVALCDVDEGTLGGAAKRFANARTFVDFRQMFDQMERDIDAAVVSTADVTHAVASMAAVKRGKGVYCQKPLTRTVKEARLLAEAARQHRVATQMGNQGHSGGGLQPTAEFIRSGAIGTIREVHTWSDRPRNWWPQGVALPDYTDPAPKNLHWDLWVGPMAERPFIEKFREGPFKDKRVYHPSNWRGWWDFGAGAMGDMACHNMDPAFWVLDLGAPTWVKATCSEFNHVSFPAWSVIEWEFPAKGDRPAVRLFWHDGGRMPPRPPELEPDRNMGDNGYMFVGETGKMIGGGWAGAGRIIPESRRKEIPAPPRTLPRPAGRPNEHYQQWLDACKDPSITPGSHFGYSGPMTEAILLGNVALWYPGEELRWDAEKLAFTNKPEANRLLHYEARRGWEL